MSRRVAITVRPQGRARRVTAIAEAPQPTRPRVRLDRRRRARDSTRAWRKAPSSMWRAMRGIRRPRERIMAITWSAISSVLKSGTLETTMPRSVARATSMRSVPLPMREMRAQSSRPSTTAAGSLAETTQTAWASRTWGRICSGSAASTSTGRTPRRSRSRRSVSDMGNSSALRRTTRALEGDGSKRRILRRDGDDRRPEAARRTRATR